MQRQEVTTAQIQALTEMVDESVSRFAAAAGEFVRLMAPAMRAFYKAALRYDPHFAAEQRARERSRRNSRNPRPKPRRRH